MSRIAAEKKEQRSTTSISNEEKKANWRKAKRMKEKNEMKWNQNEMEK